MDKFLLKVCNKDTKRKLLRDSVSIFIAHSEKFLSNGRVMAATSHRF